jgi:hypothetical protein
MGRSVELDKPAGLQGEMLEHAEAETHKPPFQEKKPPPPKFGWIHAWGTIRWGKKAGLWGQGPEGLKGREKGNK